jgi:Phage integrase family
LTRSAAALVRKRHGGGSGSSIEPEEGPCQICSSIVPVVVDRQRRCGDFSRVARRATRACATQPIHPKSSAAARADADARSAWTTGAGRNSSPGSSSVFELPIGALFCVINGATGGRPWATAAARAQLRRTTAAAGVRRRFAPHQLRHAHAVEMAREGVPLIVIQRQLGHSNLGITSVYLQGIDNAEIIETVHARRAPMIAVSASLRL